MKSYIDTKVDLLWLKLVERYKLVQHLEAIEKSLSEIEQEKKELGQPKSPVFDKVAPNTSYDSLHDKDKLYDLLNKEKQFETELFQVKAKIAEVDTIVTLLDKFPDAHEIVVYKFLENHTWYDTEKKFCFNRRSLEKKIKKSLKSLVK